MTKKEGTISIGRCIISNMYSGFNERVIYAGMPSKDSFSVIYKTAHVREDPSGGSIENVEIQLQLFYPINHKKEIRFPSRTSCKFKVKKISPESLTAIILEE